jgi:hypothetical protein
MIAFGFILFVLGTFLIWLDDNFELGTPDWFGVSAAAMFVFGGMLMLSGIVVLMWRFLP